MYKNETPEIVYIADIGQDIDDMIAVEYLHLTGLLKCMVLDGKSFDEKRVNTLKEMGVKVLDKIPEDTNIIFCGGSFTKIAKFVKNHTLKLLCANGGFAGSNIVPLENQLEKFKGKKVMRTFNLNIDVNSGIEVFESKNINHIMLISKNVCHSILNCHNGIHKDEFLNKYNLKPDKRLHDLLFVVKV